MTKLRNAQTSSCPGWLSPDGSGNFRVIAARAKVVQRIFADTLRGASAHSIATALNAEGVPVFGRSKKGWGRFYILKTLSNEAVIGKTSRKYKSGKAPNQYPAIIDEETFARVQSLRPGSNAQTMRGKNALLEVSNLLGGLAHCTRCGAPLGRVTKKGKNYLVCSTARVGDGCIYEMLDYNAVESAILANARSLITSQLAKIEDPAVRSTLTDLRAGVDVESLNRTLVNSLLRQALSSVDVDSANGLVLLSWKHGGFSELIYAPPREEKRSSTLPRWT